MSAARTHSSLLNNRRCTPAHLGTHRPPARPPACVPVLCCAAEALSHAQVYVSPLLVGGWCGLVTTALNCLPVGNLDGGRTMLVGGLVGEQRRGWGRDAG